MDKTDAAKSAFAVLQAEQQDPVVKFTWFKQMPYRRRMLISALLLAVGIGVQIVTLSFLYGAPFLIAVFVLTRISGYDSNIDYHHLYPDGHWESVPLEQLEEIIKMHERVKKWDRNKWEISNIVGLLTFVAVTVACAVVLFVVYSSMQESAAREVVYIVGADIALLVLPQWFNGMRWVETKSDLVLKVRHLCRTLEYLQKHHEIRGKVGAQLLLHKTKEGEVPEGAKLVVTFDDGPEYFYGVQTQVVINRVQGKPHPYCYSVVIARQGYGLQQVMGGQRVEGTSLIKEFEHKGDVDVIIVRRYTTRTSGYKTGIRLSAQAMRTALKIAYAFLEAKARKRRR